MGCINSSTKGLNELRSSAVGVVNGAGSAAFDTIGNGTFYNNVYRVRACLLSEENGNQNGFLELTPREILFLPLSNSGYTNSIVWSLQHLRRYGASDETFSFEAGRRSMTGAGVFTFGLDDTEVFYRIFQYNINNVAALTDDSHNQSEHPSNMLARPHVNINNYLHPSRAQRACSNNCESNNPASQRLDSPDSPSTNSNANEALLFAHNSRYTPHTRNSAVEHIAGNIYSERPVSNAHEQNNNNNINSFIGMNNNDQSELSICGESGTASAFSTISRKLLLPRSSHDIALNTSTSLSMTPTTPLRIYANIDNMTDFQTGNLESCYENVRGIDFPIIFPPFIPISSNVPSVGGSNPTTPGVTTNATLTRLASIADPESMSLGSGGENSTQAASLVNYIVLDLDQPRSPVTVGSQYSPKTPFGSEFSISVANTELDEASLPLSLATPTCTNNTVSITATSTGSVMTTSPNTTVASTTTTTTTTTTTVQKSEAEEQQLDYSTIDFVKTWALIESSTNGLNFDVDPDPDIAEEELRITRHSKCVRKAYSISE